MRHESKLFAGPSCPWFPRQYITLYRNISYYLFQVQADSIFSRSQGPENCFPRGRILSPTLFFKLLKQNFCPGQRTRIMQVISRSASKGHFYTIIFQKYNIFSFLSFSCLLPHYPYPLLFFTIFLDWRPSTALSLKLQYSCNWIIIFKVINLLMLLINNNINDSCYCSHHLAAQSETKYTKKIFTVYFIFINN